MNEIFSKKIFFVYDIKIKYSIFSQFSELILQRIVVMFHQHMCQHLKVTVYKFLWQHLIMTAVPQESDLSKLELAQAELKRLEEENASLREAKFGLERFYSDDNSDAETGGRFRKSENTVLKVVICP